jgi:F-type H+-transporting ATPase subunit delta
MNESIISTRYAKSLFLLARDTNSLEPVKKDIEAVYEVCCKVKEFDAFLKNPSIEPTDKEKIIKTIFGKKRHDYTNNLIHIILQNNREIFLKDISQVFLDLYRKYKGIKKATIVSTVPLSKNAGKKAEKILEKVFHTKIEFEEHIDPSIIGGFMLRVEDQQIDASVKNKLRILDKAFKQAHICK